MVHTKIAILSQMKTFLSFLFLISITATPFFALAQAPRGTDPLNVTVTPQAPAPGVQTTITLTSTPIDLGRAIFIWSVNGSPKQSGPGIRTFSFTMGKATENTVVSVDIQPANGTPFSRTFTFRPGNVTLLWEADTYSPPWYRGKSIYTPGSDMRIVAVPSIIDEQGNTIPSNQLIYRWQIGGDPYADRSGLGRNTLYVTGNQLEGDQDIAVDILRSNGLRSAHAEITIPAEAPQLLLYKNDPLRGTLYNQALTGTVQLTDTETTILAEPYFLSGGVRQPNLVLYEWALNDNDITPQAKDQYLVTLRQSAGQSGQAKLTASMQNSNLKRLLQNATAELYLVFGVQ